MQVFPLWALIVGYFNHILLVLNCCSNAVIYCLLSSKFRVVAVKHYNELVDKVSRFFQRLQRRQSQQDDVSSDTRRRSSTANALISSRNHPALRRPSHSMAVNCDGKNKLTVELAPMQTVTVTVTAASKENSRDLNSSSSNGAAVAEKDVTNSSVTTQATQV